MPVKETLLDAKAETVARRVRGLPLLKTAIVEAFGGQGGGGGGGSSTFLVISGKCWMGGLHGCHNKLLDGEVGRGSAGAGGGGGGDLSLKATVEDEA